MQQKDLGICSHGNHKKYIVIARLVDPSCQNTDRQGLSSSSSHWTVLDLRDLNLLTTGTFEYSYTGNFGH
jgi:hypothetical protein